MANGLTSLLRPLKVKSNGPTHDCERQLLRANQPAPDVIPAAPAQAGRHKS